GKLGQIDMYSATDEMIDVTFEDVELDSNSKYYFLFRTVGKNDSFTAYSGRYLEVTLGSLELKAKMFGDELISFELSAETATVFENESIKLAAKAIYAVAGETVLENGVEYSSSDDLIATVTQNGTVVGVKEGNARITAKVAGTNFADTFDVVVKARPRATKEYNYDFTNAVFGVKTDVSRSALAEMTLETPDEKLSSPWRVAATTDIYNVNAKTAGLYWNAVDVRATNKTGCFGVEIDVLESGTYIPSIKYIAKQSAPIVDIYLVKEGTISGGVATSELKYAPVGNDYSTVLKFISNLDDSVKLAQVDMYAKEEQPKEISFGEVFLDADSHYYLLYRAVDLNPDFVQFSTRYFEVTTNSLKLKPPAGDFNAVGLVVEDLINESDPMPNMTSRQLDYKLYDDIGIEITDFDKNDVSVVYSSEKDEIATISEDGVITAHQNGTVKLFADITYKGTSKRGVYNLLVAPSGRNMMESLNPDFETDEWCWTFPNEPNIPSTPKFVRSYIATEENGNRALKFEFDGNCGNTGVTGFLKNSGYRVPVKPGRLYQLSFKFKADYEVPSGASDMLLYFDLYTYTNPTGNSSASIAFNSNRSMNLAKTENFHEE
ncbi:MAG: Ig-like domain-containing protein, partial [Oscillospiraceae bacterium]|nr:Ig-like domain-containing protein [Oscillospiraceae bacterium]